MVMFLIRRMQAFGAYMLHLADPYLASYAAEMD